MHLRLSYDVVTRHAELTCQGCGQRQSVTAADGRVVLAAVSTTFAEAHARCVRPAPAPTGSSRQKPPLAGQLLALLVLGLLALLVVPLL